MDNILCSYCELKFRNDSDLKDHFKKGHAICLTKPPDGKFECKTNNCGRAFKQSRDFFKHVNLIHCVAKRYDDTDEELEVREKKKKIGIHLRWIAVT